MSTTGLDMFDATIHTTHIWLKDIMQEMEWENRPKTYLGLRMTLYELRDRLPG